MFEVFAAFAGGELAAEGVGVRGVDAVRHQDVVAGHHTVEAEAVAGLGDLRQRAGLGVGAVIGQVKTELHQYAPWAAGREGEARRQSEKGRAGTGQADDDGDDDEGHDDADDASAAFGEVFKKSEHWVCTGSVGLWRVPARRRAPVIIAQAG